MKTQKEIDEEVTKLKAIKPKLGFDAFGGNNKSKCQAEIDALTKDWDQSDVDDLLDSDDLDDDEAGSAAYAIDWKDGREEESPSSQWEPLIKGK
jgi:hypothetical protein